MNKPVRIYDPAFIAAMPPDTQRGYLMRVWYRIQNAHRFDMSQCPSWLYFVTDAFFTGDTTEIEGTYWMGLYRDILLNQINLNPSSHR